MYKNQSDIKTTSGDEILSLLPFRSIEELEIFSKEWEWEQMCAYAIE